MSCIERKLIILVSIRTIHIYNKYYYYIMSLGGFIGSVFGSVFDKIFSWKVLKGVISSMMAHKAYWAKQIIARAYLDDLADMGVPKFIIWGIKKFLDMIIVEWGSAQPPGASHKDGQPQLTQQQRLDNAVFQGYPTSGIQYVDLSQQQVRQRKKKLWSQIQSQYPQWKQYVQHRVKDNGSFWVRQRAKWWHPSWSDEQIRLFKEKLRMQFKSQGKQIPPYLKQKGFFGSIRQLFNQLPPLTDFLPDIPSASQIRKKYLPTWLGGEQQSGNKQKKLSNSKLSLQKPPQQPNQKKLPQKQYYLLNGIF